MSATDSMQARLLGAVTKTLELADGEGPALSSINFLGVEQDHEFPPCKESIRNPWIWFCAADGTRVFGTACSSQMHPDDTARISALNPVAEPRLRVAAVLAEWCGFDVDNLNDEESDLLDELIKAARP